MRFIVAGRDTFDVDLACAVVAGFTGRDREAAEEHLLELTNEGVPVPDEIPSFYVVPARLVTQESIVTVTHDRTSGEAEAVLVLRGRETFVALGSDHTDRLAETRDIALSKLACPKVVSGRVWPLEDVEDHWDALHLRSWIEQDGERVLYQDGALASLLSPSELLATIPWQEPPRHPFAVFAGTVPAQGGIRSARRFVAELRDNERNDVLTIDYEIEVLDVLRGQT
ncbi:MAG: DUF2848 family protein [Nitriliruptorales bacterium]